MIATAVAWLVAKGVPANLAKPLLIGGGFILILVALAGAKCAYDRSIIKSHDAAKEAEIAKADRKADAQAADERLNDAARSTSESAEIKEAINEAKAKGIDPRAAYYACVRLQQAARHQHKPSPDC